jgi:coenzyme F420-reducing hydrogenase alpha subunit
MATAPGDGARTIRIKALARVEGEAGLTLHVRQGRLASVEFRIFEAPRFFEAMLPGRRAAEAPDITSRICGICPVAYQMSSVHALEKITGTVLPPNLRALRRLLYCGEWIESHTLHVFLLQIPDFLGFESSIAMAQAKPEYAEWVKRGLRIKKAGNAIVRAIGGREVHPINVRVGGFYCSPKAAEIRALREELQWARDAAISTVRWTAALSFPDQEMDYEFVALRHPQEYPMNEGSLISSRGMFISQEDYTNHFEEFQAPHTHALQSRRRGGDAYFVGPLARWNLNSDLAPPITRQVAAETGIPFPNRNSFVSIVVRALEILLAIEESLRLIDAYEPPPMPHVPIESRAGAGQAITEAPRGILYNSYETDAEGLIRKASIIPPTSQNQLQIERELYSIAPRLLSLPDDAAAMEAEKLIRNYDPCISCATHFLEFRIDRQ